MPYATLQDLVDRYGEDELIQLTDDAGAGTVDVARVDRALADATNEINGYLSTNYQIPLTTVPDLVALWCVNIARYRLWSRRDLVPELVSQLYRDALKQLDAAAAGRINLPGAAGVEPLPRDPSDVLLDERGPTFTDASLRSFG